ncbi:Gypsy retrotransposon integrase-like protein 1 [Paramarasmius palmivorus]|uniref:Gypsy retrotransposon integrase-like protein 1 n=1 Tax=Paramarasmius palmivorus TaxID=297713 RepID=A0AAW0E8Y4_9AGAR
MTASDEEETKHKKRARLQNACDECRRRKGFQIANMPAGVCSNCIAAKIECNHTFTKKKRGPKPTANSQHNNSTRTLVEEILSPTTPYVVPNDPSDVRRALFDLAQRVRYLEHELATRPKDSMPIQPSPEPDVEHKNTPIPESSEITTEISDSVYEMNTGESRLRHYGTSSRPMLVQTALNIKNAAKGEEDGYDRLTFTLKRPEFWELSPWQHMPTAQPAPLVFPDPDLITTLLELYFENFHPIFSLLHRQTFGKSVLSGLHYRDRGFGATLLAVCAIASRFSDDPRVFYPGSNSKHSVGWRWFGQLDLSPPTFMQLPSLYELQLYCLATMFINGASCPQFTWAWAGIGLRRAQDIGLHRRKEGPVTAEGELLKRAFFMLVTIDVMTSTFTGRPQATTPDDFDLDLPVDCDDEYWDHEDPNLAFKQPPGKPSSLAYGFSQYKLVNILSYANRTLFAFKRPQLLAVEQNTDWKQRILSQIDKALIKWVHDIPDHLKWDPLRQNKKFFHQSMSIYAVYYWIQMQIHRPFIRSQKEKSAFPSLAICANAARSCLLTIELMKRRAVLPLTSVIVTLFDSAVLLLVEVWKGGRVKELHPDKGLAEVYRCLALLQTFEDRYQIAGQLSDILSEIIAKEDPSRIPSVTALKRRRTTDTTDPTLVNPFSLAMAEEPRQYAGNARAAAHMNAQPSQPQSYHVPVYSSELGNIPVHADWFSANTGVGTMGTVPHIAPSIFGGSEQPEQVFEGFYGYGYDYVVPEFDSWIGGPGMDNIDWDIYGLGHYS